MHPVKNSVQYIRTSIHFPVLSRARDVNEGMVRGLSKGRKRKIRSDEEKRPRVDG